jgi:hypothetical protein
MNLTSHESVTAVRHYRTAAFTAIAGSIGIIIGSMSPWVQLLILSANGVDLRPSGLVTLGLGTWCGITLAVQCLYGRATPNPLWAVPVTWAVFLAAAICCTVAATFIIRVTTSPKASLFGVPVGMEVGWGLWLVFYAAALVCVAAHSMSVQIELRSGRQVGTSRFSGHAVWRCGALMISAVIAIAGCVYAFANPVIKDSDPSANPGASMPAGLGDWPTSRIDLPTYSPPTAISQHFATVSVRDGGGETLYAGKNMICRQSKSPAGKSIDGAIGDRDTRGASLRLQQRRHPSGATWRTLE